MSGEMSKKELAIWIVGMVAGGAIAIGLALYFAPPTKSTKSIHTRNEEALQRIEARLDAIEKRLKE